MLLFIRHPSDALKVTRNKIYQGILSRYLLSKNKTPSIIQIEPNESQLFSKETGKVLVCLHLYYLDLANEFVEHLETINVKFDLIITTVIESPAIAKKFEEILLCKEVKVITVRNLGRDIYPFFRAVENISIDDYVAICKIHSKKSPHLENGEFWRKNLVSSLLSPPQINSTLSIRDKSPSTGIVGPRQFFHGENECLYNAYHVYKLLNKIKHAYDDVPFFGGTMFWLFPDSLEVLKSFESKYIRYSNPTVYRVDGMIEHALERTLPAVLVNSGFTIGVLPS